MPYVACLSRKKEGDKHSGKVRSYCYDPNNGTGPLISVGLFSRPGGSAGTPLDLTATSTFSGGLMSAEYVAITTAVSPSSSYQGFCWSCPARDR